MDHYQRAKEIEKEEKEKREKERKRIEIMVKNREQFEDYESEKNDYAP